MEDSCQARLAQPPQMPWEDSRGGLFHVTFTGLPEPVNQAGLGCKGDALQEELWSSGVGGHLR